jgi:hypothetical protein
MPNPIEQAILQAADSLHELWREGYRAANGDSPRWKALNDASVGWLQTRKDIPSSSVRTNPETKKPEIDIASLPNSKLPPQFAEENLKSAKGAVQSIAADPGSTMEERAAHVHDQWLERNGSWAPENQKLPYSQLSEIEKEKDRVVVRAAEKAMETQGVETKRVVPAHANALPDEHAGSGRQAPANGSGARFKGIATTTGKSLPGLAGAALVGVATLIATRSVAKAADAAGDALAVTGGMTPKNDSWVGAAADSSIDAGNSFRNTMFRISDAVTNWWESKPTKTNSQEAGPNKVGPAPPLSR